MFSLFNTHAYRIEEIHRAIGQHGLWRSANFAFGQRMANFYGFLNARIPHDTTVAIPVLTRTPEPLRRISYVEFFLQPRLIEYCETTPERCLERLGDQNYAVLITDLEALLNKENWGERLQAFDKNWAVLLPEAAAAGQPWSPYTSFAEIFVTSLPAVLFLLALILPGTLLAGQMLPTERLFLHLALGIGSGIGWFTLGTYTALLLGAEASHILFAGLVGLYWLFTGAMSFFLWKRRGLKFSTSRPSNETFLQVLLLLPVGLSFIVSIGNGFTTTDELVLWGAKGYGIQVAGLSEGVTGRGTLTTWYPLNVPLMISTFLALFGERLPESKLIFPLFLLGSIGLAYSFLLKHTTPRLSVLATLLLSTTPVVFAMSTLAHGNLPFTFYLVGGALMLHYAQLPTTRPNHSYWFWGMLFLVFAAWTRPEGLHLAWAVALAALFFYHRDLRKQKEKLIALLGAIGLYTIFWAVTSPLAYYRSGFTDGAFSTAFRRILAGEIHFWEAGFILQSMVTRFMQPEDWGSMGWIVLLCVILAAITKSKLKSRDMLGFGLVVVLSVYAGFWANTYTPYEVFDISGWMNTAFMRLVLPGLVLIWLQLIAHTASIYFPTISSPGLNGK
ncbi:MAG: glycosyltransferase family 39 protein [Anaerolineales bacterium]|nr:glycosyltransferase family 39 protein [Anaerolineales bacterium]